MERESRLAVDPNEHVHVLQAKVDRIYSDLPPTVKDYIWTRDRLKDPELEEEERQRIIFQGKGLYRAISHDREMMDGLTNFGQAIAELAFCKSRMEVE